MENEKRRDTVLQVNTSFKMIKEYRTSPCFSCNSIVKWT